MWRREQQHLPWREALSPVKQEVLQQGSASLPTLVSSLAALSAAAASSSVAATSTGVADGLVCMGQQLTAHCSDQHGPAQLGKPQQHQAQQQQVLAACCTYCELVKATLVAAAGPQQQPQRPGHRRQQQQPSQQQQQQQLLPNGAATAICSCLRQLADQQQQLHQTSGSAAAAQLQLQLAAVTALGVLLQQQLPAIATAERSAALMLLLSLAQQHAGAAATGSSTSGSSNNSTLHAAVAAEAGGAGAGLEVTTAAVEALGQLCKSSSSGSGSSGLAPEELSAVGRALVDALTSSTASSSRSSSGGGGAATGSSSGGSSSGGRRGPAEDVAHCRYYAALLLALHSYVAEDKQGWQGFTGQLTEAARKLLTYGTHQPQQPQTGLLPAQQQPQAGPQPAAAPAAAAAPAPTVSPGKPRYMPPHLRTAAGAAAAVPQDQQQQHLAADDADSCSEWSDLSDTEQQPAGGDTSSAGSSPAASRRTSRASSSSIGSSSIGSSSASSRAPGGRRRPSAASLLQQQQAAAGDAIRAYRVRLAVLQLLQGLAQGQPAALHPYLSALLPAGAPLAAQPLSPHLLTVLLHDPLDKVRLLAAAVLSALLEGPAARGLLAVAQACGTTHSHMRGFTTVSASLANMLLALHTALTAVLDAWRCQQQQQQQAQPQPQPPGSLQASQQLPPVPTPLLAAVLRVLGALVSATPYDRLPSGLLTGVVEATWQLWQQLQLQAAAAGDGDGDAAGSSGSGSLDGSIMAAVAVLAQALSTKKPQAALDAWLRQHAAATAADKEADKEAAAMYKQAAAEQQQQQQQQQQQDAISTAATAGAKIPALQLELAGSSSSSRSRVAAAQRGLLPSLLAACQSRQVLLRIEALAAMRGGCLNYPAALLPPGQGVPGVPGTHDGSSSSSAGSSWAEVLAAARLNLAASLEVPRTPRGTPAASATAAASAALAATGDSGAGELPAAGAAGAAAAAAGPEDRAAQHALKLLGDWLAAAWKLTEPGGAQAAAATPPPASAAGVMRLAGAWGEALQLLLAGAQHQHPCYLIRSAAVSVTADIPAAVWQQLAPHQQQQVLAAAAAAAKADPATAARAAAAKVLGKLVLLPGLLPQGASGSSGGEALLLQLLQPLAAGVRDASVSVRLSASWALANACDALRLQPSPPDCDARLGSDAAAPPTAPPAAAANGIHASSSHVPAAVLQLLCESAVASACDGEKVRANGIRAVGALLAAWQPQWGLTAASSSSGDSADAQPAGPAATATAGDDWAWVQGWLRSAAGVLQSCLAARSMKVVWNAAYAAGGLLQNAALLAQPAVAAAVPALLLVLVVLVRDSSNFKIKTHAAAALGAVRQRQTFGETFADALLVLAATLEAVDSSSSATSSSSSNGVAAERGATPLSPADAGNGAGATEDDGSFPNFRYIPGLVHQLQLSLVHMLGLLQQSDAARLQEPLQRRRAQLMSVIRGPHTATEQRHVDELSTVEREQLPSDPFSQDGGGSASTGQPSLVAACAGSPTGGDDGREASAAALRGLQAVLGV